MIYEDQVMEPGLELVEAVGGSSRGGDLQRPAGDFQEPARKSLAPPGVAVDDQDRQRDVRAFRHGAF
jgi:hypothetical protein